MSKTDDWPEHKFGPGLPGTLKIPRDADGKFRIADHAIVDMPDGSERRVPIRITEDKRWLVIEL